MYDFMNVNIDDYQPPKTVPNGTEARVRITEVEPNAEKCYILCKLEIEGQDSFTSKIRHFVTYPKPEDDATKRNNKLGMLKNFYEGFDITPGSDPQSWIGHGCWVIINEETDPTYGPQNSLGRYSTKK